MEKLDQKVINAISGYMTEKGWDVTDEESVSEVIRYGNEVFEKIGDAHRWYDEVFRVVEVDGALIGYNDFHTTGDNSASDMGLEFDWSSVSLVEKKEIVAFEYVRID